MKDGTLYSMIFFHLPVTPQQLNYIKLIGSGFTDTPDYYKFAEMRTDESHILFQYSLSGEGRIKIGNEIYPVPAGHGFLCDPLDPDLAYYYPEHGREPWEFIFVVIHGNRAAFRELTGQYGSVFALDANQIIIRKLTHLSRLHERAGYQAQYLPTSTATGLVGELFSALIASKEENEAATPAQHILRQAIREINENLEKRVTVETVAQAITVSRVHLARVFKQELGISPGTYIDQQKVRRSCELFRQTNLTIREIAYLIGYENPGDFSRMFKRVTGQLPSKLRASGQWPF